MKVPFAKLSRKIKGLLKGSEKGHRIRITPHATVQHYAIGTINPELTAITIDGTSTVYIRSQREFLEHEFPIDEHFSAILTERHVSESARRSLDEKLANNSKEVRRWKKASKKYEQFMSLIRIRRNPSIPKEVAELRKENQRLKRQINNSSGIVVEMMLAGIIPMTEPPPFPLQGVTQMRYGCDYLSHEWKDGYLHLHWIEANLDRSGNYPTFTPTEKRFQDAIRSDRVVNHYHHTWINQNGDQHWD